MIPFDFFTFFDTACFCIFRFMVSFSLRYKQDYIIKGGATIGGGGVMTPHLFQILVFSLYSLVFAQCIDPPTFKFLAPLLYIMTAI